MITGINESKTLTKHISCQCKCKFDGTKCKSNKWWNNDKYRCECKKHHICEKDYVWNPATCNCENGKYLASIKDDSVITCAEVIKSYDEEIKTSPTNFDEKNITCKTQSFYILLTFYISRYYIIDSCQYILLSNKMLNKNKNIYYHFLTQN